MSSYKDELRDLHARAFPIPALNASQIKYICQVLLENDNFNYYKVLRRRMYAVIGPPGSGKKQQ